MQPKEDKHLQGIRHSLAHLLAASVVEMYPGAKNSIGPAVENGFYQDFETPKPISDEDLPKIEARMRELYKKWGKFMRKEATIEEARKQFAWNPYKLELAEEFAKGGKQLTFYISGDFVDLCKGGHVDDMRQVDPKAFRLVKVSGAYWRGDQKRQQLQRIYGVAFETEEELRDYLNMVEEAKKRDHRRIGKELQLFMFSDLVGPGLPLWLPNGELIRHELMEYMREKEVDLGYQYVTTPVLAGEELYKRTGHAKFYTDDMYSLKDAEGNTFYLKPMNCPHHHMIYEQLVQSYRDLPLKLSEHAGLYRNELSGTLSGLIRVRGPITQNDAHIYIEQKDVKAEFLKVLELFRDVYDQLGIRDYWYRLSLPDFEKGKYEGDRQVWEDASQAIREALTEFGATFVEATGEAAFYGPKLDVQVRNVLGKEDSIATNQVDILVPQRMGLTYIDSDGEKQTPIVLHRAILGSFERFIGFLLEQTAGKLPVWLAPDQVRLITVNQEDATVDFATKIAERARKLNVRTTVDNSNESVGKKIRAAELMKVPYTVVIGEKEIAEGKLVPRVRSDMAVKELHEPRTIEEFLKTVAHEASSRVSKSSL
jgi:threonyl-tRNA synthetase